MASIGKELKRERELRSVSLKEIAEATKINIRFLRALEEDRLDMLPEKFFTRGIIRAYAVYLGLDEQSVLNTYLESLQARESGEEEAEEENTGTRPGKSFRTAFFSATALAVLAAAVIFLILHFQKKPQPGKVKTSPHSPQVEESPGIPLPADRVLPEEEPAAEEKTLLLEISVEQETWMEIYADAKLQFSGIKYPGARLQFQADQAFLIHLGNAGGIVYTLNGKEGKKFGAPGAVVRDIRITLENFEDYLLHPEGPS